MSDRTPHQYAWSARLARIGVDSMETRPRRLDHNTMIFLIAGRPVPLTDPRNRLIGSVVHVHKTATWLYAFGFVTDGETADQMRSKDVIPELALTRYNTRTPTLDGPLIFATAYLGAVRAAVNPRTRPGPAPLWSGVTFTVED